MDKLIIRPAAPADMPALLDIYNDVVAHSTAIYALEPASPAQRQAWYDERIAAGYPVIVAAAGDQVLGYASYAEFRGMVNAYRHSVEHSVHVRADLRGRGIGSKLVRALFPMALAQGKHVMLGAIDASNTGSLRMHERLGFEQVALLREVGHKFGRWLDLALVQRFLDPPGAHRPVVGLPVSAERSPGHS